MKLLIIGHTFPEPGTTAAGTRMMQLIDLFREQDAAIHFATTAVAGKHAAALNTVGVETHAIELNSPTFNTFLSELQPDMVLFDRFVTEEQFGWSVAEICPKAVRVLDTEDLHFLRKAREEAYKNSSSVQNANLFTETAKRELASILRCDISLIISEVELQLLIDTFNVPDGLLYYLPIYVTSETVTANKQNAMAFEQRNHFVAFGNLKHAPNLASVQLLKQAIWPTIRKQLPEAQLHVYGAYANQHVQEMHNPKEGFFIKGWVADISAVLQHSKVQLAPLPFGAGIKGKLLESMQHGLPVVTTSIGAEGMFETENAPGFVTHNWTYFSEKAMALYSDKDVWIIARKTGFAILEQRFLKRKFQQSFQQKIKELQNTLENHRNTHFISQILQHQTLQASKYMSKWIAEKNTK